MSSKEISTRERILKATWAALEAGDPARTRMADIAKRADISRQGLYLHFPNRADLLIETTRYIDEINKVDELLVPSRAATSGQERLDAFIAAWASYIPQIYPVAKALMGMGDSDVEAKSAWQDRMRAMRDGCNGAVEALELDGQLMPHLTVNQATDLLWSVLSVRVWEHLRLDCGWSAERYLEEITRASRAILQTNAQA